MFHYRFVDVRSRKARLSMLYGLPRSEVVSPNGIRESATDDGTRGGRFNESCGECGPRQSRNTQSQFGSRTPQSRSCMGRPSVSDPSFDFPYLTEPAHPAFGRSQPSRILRRRSHLARPRQTTSGSSTAGDEVQRRWKPADSGLCDAQSRRRLVVIAQPIGGRTEHRADEELCCGLHIRQHRASRRWNMAHLRANGGAIDRNFGSFYSRPVARCRGDGHSRIGRVASRKLANGEIYRDFTARIRPNIVPDQEKSPGNSLSYQGFLWWAWQGLNLRPLRCQHSALPLSYTPAGALH